MPHAPTTPPPRRRTRVYTTQRDDTERAAAVDRLRAKLSDPSFRAIEGFPIGEDEAILALSDPPYYTACPNPFLPEIVARWQEERRDIRAGLGLPNDAANGYSREPFAADVSEGKNDPGPVDIVFDMFCGTARRDWGAAQHLPGRIR